ncbi:MAG: tRNA (guanosine(37)-N1)-methyltransferase TrmD [bacterium]|nr:tRNA (guanosine(37)-N1)-methyltransferase TrmD [bacterium]
MYRFCFFFFGMEFDIITIFPHLFDSFLNESIIKRAQKQGLIKIRVFDLRKWANDPHKSVDNKPYGGGRGMVMMVEPIYRALAALRTKRTRRQSTINNTRTILFSPRGKKFSQKIAYQYSKLKRIVMICGRYEGVDERVAQNLINEQVSIGDYVMMGGEVAAMAVMEAVSRLIPGVLGHSEQLKERITGIKGGVGPRRRQGSGGQGGFTEYPQYTRPEVYSPHKNIKWKTPKILLSGNHKKIKEWRQKHQKLIK